MANKMEIYKCKDGIVIEVIEGQGCELSCCGEPMTQLVENTVDAAVEKHIPVVERADGKVKVKVGSVAHPMAPEHYIGFIECITDGHCLQRCYLDPGDAPEAEFNACCDGVIVVRAYCNLHGLWKAE